MNEMTESVGLTPHELEQLKKYTSANYGLIDLNSKINKDSTDVQDSTLTVQELLKKGIIYYRAQASDPDSKVGTDIFCRLGHLHLLLGEYSDALSAYQHYSKASKDANQDGEYLYGSGLVYFHYNAFQWSQESLKRLLMLDSKFSQAKEVNIRLGVMYKWKGEFAASLECFMEALSDTNSCTMSTPNIQYHIGHIHSIQGRYKFAKEVYELILTSSNIPNSVESLTLRELGWLIHNVPELAQGEYHEMKAIELLKKSLEINENCGKAWYYLGRVFASICCIHDAFMAYRRAVTKPGAQADTWCAIGVLYQQQGQPIDSLQAYISAVYLDPKHIASWTDMGLLYEAMEQPIDAYICYQNAVNTRALSDKAMKLVLPKAQQLHCFISSNRQQLMNAQRFLPSVKQAWTDLVPGSVKSKSCHKEIPLLFVPGLDQLQPITPYQTFMPPFLPNTGFGCYNIPKYNMLGSPARKSKNGKGKVPKEPIILPSVMGIQDPGLLGFQDASINGMPPVGGMQSFSGNNMQPHASSSFMPNNNSIPVLPPTQVPFYQPSSATSQPPPAPPLLTNGGTNTVHYGNKFYDSTYHPLPNFTDTQLNPGSLQATELSSNRLALHSHDTTPFNGYSSTTSLDNVSLDKELPDLGQLNSPLFSDASYNHNIVPHPFFPAGNEFTNSQSPSTSATNSLTSSFDITRKRSSCLDVLPDSKQLKLLSGIPTPSSQEIDNGLDIFSTQTTPRSTISTSTSMGTPDSFGVPCISSHTVPDHFSFKPNCDALDLINAAGSSCSSGDNNYWGNFDSFDPSLTPEDLLNESSIKPFVASQKGEEQMRQRKLDALDILESLAEHKDNSLTSPNTDNQSSSRDDVSLKSYSGSLVAGSPFQLSKVSESFPVESVLNEEYVLNEENYDPVDDNEVFVCKNDLPVAEETNQSNQELESQQSARESTESMSDSSPKNVRNSTLSSTDGQIIRRSRFYSSRCSDLTTPLSVSSRFSCSSPSQVSGRISPVSVVIPPDVVANEYMKCDPLLPPSPPPVTEELDLHPDVPIIEASSLEEALSYELHSRCLDPNIPICLIRGVTDAVGFDLTQFSSKTLVETYPELPMDVREQRLQTSDENWDSLGKRQIWRCESSRSSTTIGEYAVYQQNADWNVTDGCETESPQDDTDSSGYSSSCSKRSRSRRMLRFGTNGDLSDTTRWHSQVAEIDKLPKFLRVNCPEANILNHIGYTVLGMNSVQLYLKVPGSRTTGHQENNNFCSVNVNIGPGKCEWYATPSQYWGKFHKLCEKHKVTFLRGSWWPLLKELQSHNIPVYRFDQQPGDIVWINPGTVHWVQANEVCNNIAWNVGPINAYQFKMCWERYEWNKVQKEQSIVPAILLAWNMAKALKISEKELHSYILSILEESYDQSKQLLASLTSAKIPIHWHGRVENEPALYCNSCSEEVFNILFVIKKKGIHHVYCHKCAAQFKKKQQYVVLQQYSLLELEEVINNFKHLLD